MKALVYRGPGKQSLEERPTPKLQSPTDGRQPEYVVIPRADTSLHAIPDGTDEDSLEMLSDDLSTGFEFGV